MPTEVQIEVAHAVLRKRKCFVPWEDLTAALEAADKAVWQPIETAPNDETILVAYDGGEVRLIEADDNDYSWQAYRPRGVGEVPFAWRPAPDCPPLPTMGDEEEDDAD